jgi:hypothetical protein
MAMLWVGVRYRGIALPEIMAIMRVWLDRRRYQTKTFEYVISGTGTLVRVQFTHDAEAADFAEAFAGFVSPARPSIESSEGMKVNETLSTEGSFRGSA